MENLYIRCLICLLYSILIALVYYYHRKEKILQTDNDTFLHHNSVQNSEGIDSNSNLLSPLTMRKAFDFLQFIAQKYQFKVDVINQGKEWIICFFEYQKGPFICYCGTNSDEILLHYSDVATLPYTPENYEKVRTLCSHLTRQHRYAKFIYSYKDNENVLDLHIRIESIGPSEEAFLYYLGLCFQLTNEVRHALGKEKELTEAEEIELARDREMLFSAEMAHEEKLFREYNPQSKAPNHGTLGEYISYLFDKEEVADLLSLSVQNENGITRIMQRDKIYKYDVFSAVVYGEGKNATIQNWSTTVLTLDATCNHYVFTLHPLEETKTMLFVRMTAVCTPHEFLQNYVPDATYVPKAVSMCLGFVKSELPSLEPEDTEKPSIDISKQMHHGHLLMQQKCYLQAIAVMTPIFRKLKISFFNLKDKEKNKFFALCYDLGFCYNELRQYEKAFYYLDLAHNDNRVDYSTEYFNCLAEGRDVRVLRELDKEMELVGKQIQAIDMDNDHNVDTRREQRTRLVEYFAFLMRRKGYSQINFGDLDAAEETFTNLRAHKDSRVYAENELRYIMQLRKK